MTDRELKLQKEVERLQKKVRELSEAYNRSTCELNELKSQKTSVKEGDLEFVLRRKYV